MWGFGVHLYSFGVYLKHIEADLGMSRAVISGAGSAARLEGGFEGIAGGWLVDRYGPRLVCMIGMAIGGLGLIFMHFIDSVWSYYAAWIVASFGFNLGLSMPLDAAIANWFVRRRGLANGLMRGLIGLCGVTVVTAVTMVIGHYGWRNAFLFVGFGTWLFTLPLAWFLIRPRRPEYYGLLPDGEERQPGGVQDAMTAIEVGVRYAEKLDEVEFTVRQAMRTSAFWVIWLAHAFHGMVGPAISMHQIPYLTDRGVDPVVAAAALGLMLLVSSPGRLLGGVLSDRVAKAKLPFLIAGGYFLQGLGLLIFLRTQTMAMVYVYLLVYGLATGMTVGVEGPLRGRYFGRKAFATIGGTLRFLDMPIAMIAPVYAGWSYDATGSYMNAFTLITVLIFCSAVIMCFAKPPKPPTEVGEITSFV